MSANSESFLFTKDKLFAFNPCDAILKSDK